MASLIRTPPVPSEEVAEVVKVEGSFSTEVGLIVLNMMEVFAEKFKVHMAGVSRVRMCVVYVCVVFVCGVCVCGVCVCGVCVCVFMCGFCVWCMCVCMWCVCGVCVCMCGVCV